MSKGWLPPAASSAAQIRALVRLIQAKPTGQASIICGAPKAPQHSRTPCAVWSLGFETIVVLRASDGLGKIAHGACQHGDLVS
jgi:hypothetical protein